MTTQFLASMAGRYAATFPLEEAAEHAAVVGRRGHRVVHAEACRAGGHEVVCVVLDDRPGLLALITDALLVHGLSIRSAHAFCRQRPDGVVEAVDFLALDRTLDPGEVESLLHSLTDLVSEEIRDSARPSQAPRPRGPRPRAYFDLESLRRGEHVLWVEAPDAQGLLHAITSALYAQGARILSCRIETEDGVVRDRFELASVDGSVWTGPALCDIQLAVLEAMPRR